MKVLVTGANGMLGQDLCPMLENEGYSVIRTDVDNMDITKLDDVENVLNKENPDIVIHCAAYTNVESAETKEGAELATDINTKGVFFLSGACKRVGAVLIHISTDYVFNGLKNQPYSSKDEDYLSPLNKYGYTKLTGEYCIKESGCKYLIFRTSWLYSEFGNNFVKKIYKKIVTNNSCKVVFDQTGSPTYAMDLAKFIYGIIENNNSENRYLSQTGIYHFANKGVASWYDMSKEIEHFCKKDESVLVTDCLSNEFKTMAVRPNYSVLDCSEIKKIFGYDIPYWKDSLMKCIEEIYKMTNK